MQFDVKNCPMNHKEEKKAIVIDGVIQVACIEQCPVCELVLKNENVNALT